MPKKCQKIEDFWAVTWLMNLNLLSILYLRTEMKKLENPTFCVEKSFFAYYNTCAGMHRRRNIS